MQTQLTSTSGTVAATRPVSLSLLRRAGALAGAAVLVGAVVVAAGPGRTAPVESVGSADLLRWQAVAETYAGPSQRAMDAASARLAGEAIHHSALTPAQQAAADRWGGLAARSDNG